MSAPAVGPDPRVRAVVVVPARDEQQRIGPCLQALARQRGLPAHAYEVLLVLDSCRDATRERALQVAAGQPGLRLLLLESPRPGVGPARGLGMDSACDRLLAAGRPDGLIASTDADSMVAPDWLATQLALIEAGARVIGGRVDLDEAESRGLPEAVLESRRQQARLRLLSVRGRDAPDAPVSEHHHFSGASLSLTAQTYREVGGLPPTEALEDEALERALHRLGIPIVRSDGVRVRTSARTRGRAPRGLSHDLALAEWRARRSFRASEFGVEDLARDRRQTVSVILPARDVAQTVGPIVACAVSLQRRGLIDEVLVIDAASADGTAEVAKAHGARVLQESELMMDFGPAQGKGDAMWRGLSAAAGELVVYLDADTENFREQFVVGLLGPLLLRPEIQFVKGAFRRPFRLGEQVLPGEGGRVTELLARPLLNLYAPALAGFDQPLAGEIGARRALLEQLPFPVGYGVEIAMLLDAHNTAGIDALAQVDLGERQNRHQSLRDLSAMAYAVMVAAGERLHGDPAGARVPGALALPPVHAGAAMERRAVAVEERPALSALGSSGREALPGRV